MLNANATLKSIAHSEKMIVDILAHVLVRMVSI